jgi:hypothetical protein
MACAAPTKPRRWTFTDSGDLNNLVVARLDSSRCTTLRGRQPTGADPSAASNHLHLLCAYTGSRNIKASRIDFMVEREGIEPSTPAL